MPPKYNSEMLTDCVTELGITVTGDLLRPDPHWPIIQSGFAGLESLPNTTLFGFINQSVCVVLRDWRNRDHEMTSVVCGEEGEPALIRFVIDERLAEMNGGQFNEETSHSICKLAEIENLHEISVRFDILYDYISTGINTIFGESGLA
jgi:hypothetical protein